MIRAMLCLLISMLSFAAVNSARAEVDKQPFELVRDLQRLQDHIAEGDAIAQVAHAKAIDRAARTFADAKPAVWSDPRNARALAVYLFSGGNASLIASAVPETMIAPIQRHLFAGALAYGLGDDAEARKQLFSIDAKTQPGTTGAQLALVQATLYAENDNGRAIALLDLARLLAPGTLIEEAALRKEMSLIGATGDLDKYTALARRYLGAYSKSAYADNFRQLVASAALQIGSADTEEAGRRIAKLALSLDKQERRKVYLAIARESVLSGRITMAKLAGEEAERLSQRSGPDAAKAAIYLGAAAVVGDGFEGALKTLAAAKADQLSSSDRALRMAALAVSDLIRKPPAESNISREDKRTGLVADVERSLVASETMLKRTEK